MNLEPTINLHVDVYRVFFFFWIGKEGEGAGGV